MMASFDPYMTMKADFQYRGPSTLCIKQLGQVTFDGQL